MQTRAVASQEVDGDASGIRDLTDAVWASNDNDDSRDLDQLTVADTLAGDTLRIRVASRTWTPS
jgi:exoribonuclease II